MNSVTVPVYRPGIVTRKLNLFSPVLPVHLLCFFCTWNNRKEEEDREEKEEKEKEARKTFKDILRRMDINAFLPRTDEERAFSVVRKNINLVNNKKRKEGEDELFRILNGNLAELLSTVFAEFQ